AASFQQAVVAALREVAAEALRETGARQLALAGGVAANRDLRGRSGRWRRRPASSSSCRRRNCARTTRR
ncbi:hypothetical protein AB1399_13775, partial [Hydrogenibacillus schlegelii]